MRVGEQRPHHRQEQKLHDERDGASPPLSEDEGDARRSDDDPDHCEPSGGAIAVGCRILHSADGAHDEYDSSDECNERFECDEYAGRPEGRGWHLGQ